MTNSGAQPDILEQLKDVLAMTNSHPPTHVPPLPRVRGKGALFNPILSAISRDDVAVTQALTTVCSASQLEGAQVLFHAVENECFNALKVLIENGATQQAESAFKLTIIKGQWDSCLLLMPHVPPMSDFLNGTHFNRLVQQAPPKVISEIIQQNPDRRWLQKAFQCAVQSAFNDCFDTVKLLLPLADPRAQKSGALRQAILFDNEKLIRLLWPCSNHFKVMQTFIEEEDWEGLDRLGLRLPEHRQNGLVQDYSVHLPLTVDLVTRRKQAMGRVERAQEMGVIEPNPHEQKRARQRP